MYNNMDRKPAVEMASAMGFHLASLPCRRFLRIVVMMVHGHAVIIIVWWMEGGCTAGRCEVLYRKTRCLSNGAPFFLTEF